MHELVPRPLLDAVAGGADCWRSVGPVLSADLVGFTAMAWTLAGNGDRGAEALADIADTVFAPIVEAVHGHGGYVAEFGGDAILGIFPGGSGMDVLLHAVAAASVISGSAHQRGPIQTRFGHFEVGVKVALAMGEVRWDVLDAARASRSTYVAWGAAVQDAAALAATGSPGRVLLDPTAAALLATTMPVDAVDGRHLLGAGDLDLPPATPPQPPGSPHSLATRFAPDRLLTWDRRGELRPVVTAFLALEEDAPIEDVRRLVSDVFRLIETFGGVLHQVERAEKGWVILLYWGAPVSFPGDVERALSLMLALRAQSPVRFRAGTTVGTAYSGLVGAPVQVGFSCYGSHINLAARLMGAAAPGSLLVDSSVLGNATGVASWTSLGVRALKGLGAPVEIFELAPLAAGAVTREHRVVGRRRELAALCEAVHRSARTGRLHRVALVGEPGSGKTVLLEMLRRTSEGVEGLQWTVCRSESHGTRWLHPVRDLVRRWSGLSSIDDVAVNAERFSGRLHALARGVPEGLGARLLERGSFLAALVDLPVAGSTWAATPPEDRFDGMVEAVTSLLTALSATGPLVLVLDDVQWLDPTSHDLLVRLLDALADSAVTVISTCHEIDQVQPPVDRQASLVLTLGRLDVEQVVELARSLLGYAPPPWLGGWLIERTEGNPLFVEQLVTYLAGEGLLSAHTETETETETDGGSSPPADLSVPPDLRGVLVARFDRLSSGARRALEAGATLGRQFERHVLHRTLAVLRVDAARDVEAELLSSGIWTAEQEDLSFTHQLLWAAASDMPLSSTLRSLHAAAAQALEDTPDEGTGRYVTRLALHHRAAGDLAASAGYEARASEQALLLGAYGDAEHHAELGLDDLAELPEGDGPPSASLELTLVLALGAGRMITQGQAAPQTFAAYERAHAITESLPPTRQSFQALFGLRMSAAFRGDLRAATALGDRALAMASDIGDEDLVLEATLMVGNMEFWYGRLDQAIATLDRVRAAEPGSGHGEFVQQRRLTALLPLLLSQWLTTGDPGVTLTAQTGIVEARALGHRFSEAIVLETAAFLAALSGDVVAARRHGSELLDLAESEPFPVYAHIARVILGWAASTEDRSSAAAEQAGRAVHELAAMRVILGQTLMGYLHADAARAAGDLDETRHATSAALLLSARTGEVVMTPLLHLLRAKACGGQERRDELAVARSLAAAMEQGHVLTLVDAVDDVPPLVHRPSAHRPSAHRLQGAPTMTDARTLSTDELELVLQGACFLGSGGGGPLVLGQQFIDEIAKAPNPVRVVDVASVPADATGAISAGVGSPAAAASGFPADAPAVAWHELETATGHRLDHIVPAEIGAGNTFIPLMLSAQTGLPVIDGAGADRAVPALQLCTFAATGVPLGTVVLGNSDLVLRFAATDPAAADARMRALLSGDIFDEDAGSAMWAMSGAQIAAGAIRGTTLRALQVGALLSTSPDPIPDVAAHLGGTVLVRGTITDLGQATGGGFDTGHVTITGSGPSASSVTVVNVNENLIAYSGQSATVLATAPDLLCYVSAQGKAFSNAEAAAYRTAGTEVALVVVPSSRQMRTAYLLAGFTTVLRSIGYYGPLALLPAVD